MVVVACGVWWWWWLMTDVGCGCGAEVKFTTEVGYGGYGNATGYSIYIKESNLFASNAITQYKPICTF